MTEFKLKVYTSKLGFKSYYWTVFGYQFGPVHFSEPQAIEWLNVRRNND